MRSVRLALCECCVVSTFVPCVCVCVCVFRTHGIVDGIVFVHDLQTASVTHRFVDESSSPVEGLALTTSQGLITVHADRVRTLRAHTLAHTH